MTAKELMKRNHRAENLRVLQTEDGSYFVESEKGKILYQVTLTDEEASCTCGDFAKNSRKYPNFRCKHILSVMNSVPFQSRYLEESFQQHKIPYHITNGQCFYDRKEVKILLDYLRVISNPNSDDGNDALVNILNVPNRYIGRKFIQELKDFSGKRGVHLYEGLKSMGIDLVYVRKNVREFVAFMRIDPSAASTNALMSWGVRSSRNGSAMWWRPTSKVSLIKSIISGWLSFCGIVSETSG
jgi:superfamily I DNA/RNA helicase